MAQVMPFKDSGRPSSQGTPERPDCHCTWFLSGLVVRRTGRTHLLAHVNKNSCWCLCGKSFTALEARLIRHMSVDEVTCGTCVDAELRARMRLKPGWWAAKLNAAIAAREEASSDAP